MKSVIFLAPPLGGKGTFSDYLIHHCGFTQISTGDLLRSEAEHNEELKAFLATGAFVDDETILQIVEKELSKISLSTPIILDGIPRTLQQAKKLDIILSGLKRDVVVIYIDVDKKILLDRLLGRRICMKCHRSYNIYINEFKPKVSMLCDDCHGTLVQRDDDNLESYEVRYAKFLDSTMPVVAYYQEKGCLTVLQNNDVDQTSALKSLLEVIDDNKK